VRRDEVMEDGYAGLHALPSSALKSIIRIQFTNALGVAEAGVDGGGLFKDFLDDLVKEAFSPERGLFTVCTLPRCWVPAHRSQPQGCD
jgi:ubiquitin-protein ligase E3 C